MSAANTPHFVLIPWSASADVFFKAAIFEIYEVMAPYDYEEKGARRRSEDRELVLPAGNDPQQIVEVETQSPPRHKTPQHVALVVPDESEAQRLATPLLDAGHEVTRYSFAPRLGVLHAEIVIVDTRAIQRRATAAQFLNTSDAPLIVLGSEADLDFPLILGNRSISFVPKPVDPSALAHAAGQYATLLPDTSPRTRVLIADAGRINQLVTRTLLERMNCRVDAVENGMAACRAAARNSYGLVLMACRMPGMSGFDAAKEIRRHEQGGKRTPILGLTRDMSSKNSERCWNAGMDDFLPKPVSRGELERALERWIPQRAATDDDIES